IPDISLFAGDGFVSGSFYLICQQDQNVLDGGTAGTCDLNAPFLDIQGVGGTSAGAPAFAGIMAMVIQNHGRQANANFVLYQLYKNNPTKIGAPAANPASTCIFYDLTTGAGNNSVACQGGTPNCSNTNTAANQYGVLVDPNSTTHPAWVTTPGYDLATGLGSINVGNLVSAWSSVTSSTVTLTCVSPANACGGTGVMH